MRSSARLLVPLALICTLAGCATPTPEPTPTPTGFATEDEAFAAAEAIYREYIDRANEVDLSDPSTFEPLYELTTGAALKADKEQFSEMHAEGYTRIGTSRIELIAPRDADLEADHVELDICLDNSEIDVLDRNGQSIVSPDRPDIIPMRVTFTLLGGDARIISVTARDGEPLCGG